MRLFAIALVLCGGCDLVLLGKERPSHGPGFRRVITVTPPSAEPLADFPVSIVTMNDVGLAEHARADGGDISFEDIDGNALEFERVAYAGGSLEAWVRVSLAGQTQFVMVYGGDLATPNPTAVWGGDVLAAYHFNETAERAEDSSGNRALTAPPNRVPESSAGVIGRGRMFRDAAAGQHDELCAPMALPFELGTSSLAYSLWLDTGVVTIGNYDNPVYAGGAALDVAGFDIELGQASGLWTPGISDGGAKLSLPLTVQPYGRWVHIAVAVDRGANDRGYAYVDGQLDTSKPSNLNKAITTKGLCLGADQGFGGSVDELRVYRAAKPAAWFAAEFANARSPTFVTIGDEQ